MQPNIALKKLNLDLLTPRVRGGGGSAGKIFVTMLQYFMIKKSKITVKQQSFINELR